MVLSHSLEVEEQAEYSLNDVFTFQVKVFVF